MMAVTLLKNFLNMINSSLDDLLPVQIQVDVID